MGTAEPGIGKYRPMAGSSSVYTTKHRMDSPPLYCSGLRCSEDVQSHLLIGVDKLMVS